MQREKKSNPPSDFLKKTLRSKKKKIPHRLAFSQIPLRTPSLSAALVLSEAPTSPSPLPSPAVAGTYESHRQRAASPGVDTLLPFKVDPHLRAAALLPLGQLSARLRFSRSSQLSAWLRFSLSSQPSRAAWPPSARSACTHLSPVIILSVVPVLSLPSPLSFFIPNPRCDSS